ncbi:c-type cytochrome [Thioalkalicoccus limnaeus]|uniref:Cytochrome c-551 n=1 Tax=Thioalkalicoccus limnaeus TaxID=120681 RepID=A0ABV4BC00_9GAMM
MKFLVKASCAGVIVVAVATAPLVLADEELATQSQCMVCHKMDEASIGPSYRDVAARYRGEEGAVEKLIVKVRDGGVGNWGQIPMPTNAWVGDEKIETLVKWVLSLE